MEADKYRRSITLLCSTCAGRDFAYDQGTGPLRCTSCDRVFTRDELMTENSEIIRAEVAEVKPEIVKDVTKGLRQRLGKAFRGSKHIRFR